MKLKYLRSMVKEMAAPMTKAGLVCLGSSALLSIALSLGQCSNPETTYSHCIEPYGNHLGGAGVDQWSKFAEIYGDHGFIRARPDTSGRFNLINIFGDISDIEDHENPDSMQTIYDYLIRGKK